jgi:uncharacterized protein (TIGR02246 family)
MNTQQAATPTAPVEFPLGEASDLAATRIKAIYERFGRAWSTGNLPMLEALLAEQCDHLTLAPTGQTRCDRQELVERWRLAFARRPEGFSIRLRPLVTAVRLLGDRLALVDGHLEYSGGIGAEGTLTQRRTQRFAAVMTRQANDWLILSIRVGAAAAPLPARLVSH